MIYEYTLLQLYLGFCPDIQGIVRQYLDIFLFQREVIKNFKNVTMKIERSFCRWAPLSNARKPITKYNIMRILLKHKISTDKKPLNMHSSIPIESIHIPKYYII